jgi:DNA invertase Pin-like site-specific DNA recombinase
MQQTEQPKGTPMNAPGMKGNASTLLASGKIQPRHLERLAVVYVRQSTVQQVERHQESTRLQYNLVERAVQLGWPRQRVQVIDEDLGKSGASAEGRPGFQKLVADVGLDHVGLVLGIEMSRLARSCRDWYQLLEVCAIFGTLIGDLDGVYDPTVYNDRLLLGLKGTMSEAELHVIKQRMLQGKLAKARRGELGMRLPMGYLRRPSGEVIKDPDQQAQSTIAMVFELFARFGTVYAVLRHLVDHKVQMPYRIASGPAKGELEWRRPNRITLSNLLHHPIYAGAYAYGRRPTDLRRKKPGRPSTGRTVAKPEDWHVLLKNSHPAYITWEQFEHNVRQLESNTASALGVARKGPSMLSGLLICGRCGLRMTTQYTDNGHGLRYTCSRMTVDYAEPVCQSLKGNALDALIAELILRAMEPAAIEISLKVAEDVAAERSRMNENWQQRLERASYESERAFRQYNTAEPENRLVARTLEKKWEEALNTEESLKTEYHKYTTQQPPTLSGAEREAIRRLASDVPALWNASTTTVQDRQTIARQLIERVIVKVDGESEKVDVQVHWAGGHRTHETLIRPVARLEQLSYYEDLLKRVGALHAQGQSAGEIADRLNVEKWRPAKRAETFNRGMVGVLLSRLNLAGSSTDDKQSKSLRRRHLWRLRDLARELAMPEITLYSWLQKGQMKAHKDKDGRWLVHADAKEIARLRGLRTAQRTWSRHKRVEQGAAA